MRNIPLGITLCVLWLLPVSLLAAEIKIESKTSDTSIGQFFQADIYFNAEREKLNALSGKIVVPPTLETVMVLDGQSIVPLWVERPADVKGEINFSGVIPGAYSGSHGLLFSIRFRAKSVGDGSLKITEGKALLADGKGTEAKLSSVPLSMRVTKSGAVSILPITVKDTEPPEPFIPSVEKNSSIYKGKWFLTFATQDKLSGIDHYEVAELPKSTTAIKIPKKSWIKTKSPHQLKDQALKSFVYVKAVDVFGNTRVASLPPSKKRAVYERPEFWFILGVLLLMPAIILKKWRRGITDLWGSKGNR